MVVSCAAVVRAEQADFAQQMMKMGFLAKAPQQAGKTWKHPAVSLRKHHRTFCPCLFKAFQFRKCTLSMGKRTSPKWKTKWQSDQEGRCQNRSFGLQPGPNRHIPHAQNHCPPDGSPAGCRGAERWDRCDGTCTEGAAFNGGTSHHLLALCRTWVSEAQGVRSNHLIHLEGSFN